MYVSQMNWLHFPILLLTFIKRTRIFQADNYCLLHCDNQCNTTNALLLFSICLLSCWETFCHSIGKFSWILFSFWCSLRATSNNLIYHPNNFICQWQKDVFSEFIAGIGQKKILEAYCGQCWKQWRYHYHKWWTIHPACSRETTCIDQNYLTYK